MENLYVRLQNQEIESIVVPKNPTPEQIFAVSLLRSVDYSLTNVYKTDDISSFENNPNIIIIDMGGGKYDSKSNVSDREDGSRRSAFSIMWEEIKSYYPKELQDTFDEEFIKGIETNNVMTQWINKIYKKQTATTFTYALNASFRVVKVWLLP